jgi:hypothetical protein
MSAPTRKHTPSDADWREAKKIRAAVLEFARSWNNFEHKSGSQSAEARHQNAWNQVLHLGRVLAESEAEKPAKRGKR